MKVFKLWTNMSLIKRICIGLAVGIILSLTLGNTVSFLAIFGKLFVGALRAIAPILVFVLVISAICHHEGGKKTEMKGFLLLSVVGMVSAGIIGVTISFIIPTEVSLVGVAASDISPPAGITEVLLNILMNIIDNPVRALSNANYIGILTWAVIIGLALKGAADSTKEVIHDLSEAITQGVRWVISFAPFGIMGLVYSSIMESGMEVFLSYGELIGVLVATMLITTLVLIPLISFIVMRQNPYPLVFRALKDSGITAFFTRSSAANIPVNLALAAKLNFNKDMYSVAIPLGATINMAGAAVTISVLTMATAHTVGIQVDFLSALLLVLLATISACGASGVAGGSLLLIPLACSLFGIPGEISAQVVAIGFIIGVVQDSCETALNSHSDIVYLGTLRGRKLRQEGKRLVLAK